MKNLVLVGGVPGSGKSTFARILRSHESVQWEADMFFCYEHGKYRFDCTRLPGAHKRCQEMVELDMQKSVPTVIVTNTFVRQWERDPYIVLAKKYGYQVTWCRLEGGFNNTHGVPEEKIEKMKREFEPWKV